MMNSNNAPANFIPSVPIVIKYNEEVLTFDDEVICVEDAHLSQDFKAVAELRNSVQRIPKYQTIADDTVANFDENLLTNANFKSTNCSSSLTDSITTSTDSGNASEYSRKSRKYKHPQLVNTIAKRTRNKLTQFTQSHDSEIFNSPVIETYQRHWKNKRENVRIGKKFQPRKNNKNSQTSTSTNSKVKSSIHDGAKENNANFNTSPSKTPEDYSNLPEEIVDLTDMVCGDEKETYEDANFKEKVNLPSGEATRNFNASKRISQLKESIDSNCKVKVKSSNLPLNKTIPDYKPSKEIFDMTKKVFDTKNFDVKEMVISPSKATQDFCQLEGISHLNEIIPKEPGELNTTTKSPCNKTTQDYQQSKGVLDDSVPDFDNKDIAVITELSKNSTFTTESHKQFDKSSDFNKTGEITDKNSTLNRTIQTCAQSEVSSNLSKVFPGFCEKDIRESVEIVAKKKSALHDTFESNEHTKHMSNLQAVAGFKTNIYSPHQNGATMMDILCHLDEFETLVDDFRALVVTELNSYSRESEIGAFSLTEEEGNSEREEILIADMEDEYKQRFIGSESCVRGEDAPRFPRKICQWKGVLNKYDYKERI